MTQAHTVKYARRVPVTLRRWIETHAADKVSEVMAEGGFDFGDRGGFGYDVSIRSGWCVGYDNEASHYCIEPTVKDVIALLKTLRHCVDCDDDECRAAWGLASS